MTEGKRKANRLVHETSPYLLQHAYNPVQWEPYGDAAFDRAAIENKIVLISIGYSACHWCHVMEHESFEDENVAKVMNEHFVCIKVDREERGDVDMVYMQAVQLMTGHGGWPLNCFTLADGRPFYGGTYFRRDQWISVLERLADLYANDRGKVDTFAQRLTEGIRESERLLTTASASVIDTEALQHMVARWKKQLDNREGGPNHAPKFPLPANYRFLLRYALAESDGPLLEHVHLTLRKMAYGGIFDQLHGGFARYSTDMTWKVPHFEKMLYDNAQLISLYCEAAVKTGNSLYREIACRTIGFAAREWLSPEKYFYAAYDADSEGVEGRYYVWTKDELQETLGEKFALFSAHYRIDASGYWEDDNYILMRRDDATSALSDAGGEDALGGIEACLQLLRSAAAKRVKPGLDDKMITSWNALMCTACAQAYMAWGDAAHLSLAEGCMEFLLKRVISDRHVYRTYKGEARIDGCLDDYVFVAEALIYLYQATLRETYLLRSRELMEASLARFHNGESPLLYYSPDPGRVARPTEVTDNVIPSSNAQAATNLFYLGRYFGDPEMLSRAERMLGAVAGGLLQHGQVYAHWGCLALHMVRPFREIAVVGKNVDEYLRRLYKAAVPNAIFGGTAAVSKIPLLQDRHADQTTSIYICTNGACGLPVHDPDEALALLDEA